MEIFQKNFLFSLHGKLSPQDNLPYSLYRHAKLQILPNFPLIYLQPGDHSTPEALKRERGDKI